ncbi:MAG: 3-isopropylmalate dehydratase large subunit [Candidatus Thermoplasmatota archaeon]
MKKKGKTISEKILGVKSESDVRAGDIVDAKVDVAMAHEACAQVIEPFEKIGVKKIWDLDKVVIPLDHWVPASSEETANFHKRIREFVKKYKIKNFFDVGRSGICHQILAEKGFVLPGYLVVGTDSHTTTLGAFGAFATGIGPTEMAAVFAEGKIWLRVPESIMICANGYFQKYVGSKDLILKILSIIGVNGAVYKAIEFCGRAVERMEIWERLTLTNMAVEMGAKTGIVPSDEKTKRYLAKRCKLFGEIEELKGDRNANYEKEIEIKCNELEPQVACHPSLENVKSISEVGNIKVDQVFIGTCTNGRIEDLRIAANILKGKKVEKNTRLIISPASQEVYKDAIKEGLIEIFLDADATITSPSCSACFGGHIGILAPNEVCLSTSNRNFLGRMGSKEAKIYIASPAVAASTAITGYITDPREIA